MAEPMERPTAPDDLVGMLRSRAERAGDATAFVFLDGDGRERTISNAELDRQARGLAVAIQARAAAGDRVLVVCAPGLAYLVAFFGCLYAGTIAVPAYPPTGRRGMERLLRIAASCTPRLGVADQLIDPAALPAALGELTWLPVEPADDQAADRWQPAPLTDRPIAFLQYTSGSTGEPKGVLLSHANICHNARSLAHRLELGSADVGMSWLPPYHDMGLIGGILQPLYTGFPCVLMSPLTFAHHPSAWLEAMTRHRVTITAAPNFGYDECVRRVPEEKLAELRLDTLRYALVGAEPIRPDTLRRFADRFGPSGFAESAFHPCYGLAEATLYVTGAEPGRPPKLADGRVSCGRGAGGDRVVLVNPSRGRPCQPGEVGEIWISGPTVAAGYWDEPEATEQTFGARLPDDPASYLRSGDLGVQLDGELYLTGRIKDLIVVRGRNHHPQDLEYTVELAWPGLAANRQAAFGVESGDGEQVVLVSEVTPELPADTDAAIAAIQQAVMTEHGLRPADVVLVKRGSVPRTTSGKIRRQACRQRYLAGELSTVAALLPRPLGGAHREPPSVDRPASGEQLLLRRLAEVLGLPAERLRPDLPLVAQGIDSLRAAELRAVLADEFGIETGLAELLDDRPLAELGRHLVGRLHSAADRRASDSSVDRRASAEPSADGQPVGDGQSATTVAATAAQHRMWLLNRMGAGPAYHLAGGLRMLGPVDLDALRRAFAEVLRRHRSLHSTFTEDDPAGGLRRREQPAAAPELPLLDLSDAPDRPAALDAACRSLAEQPFDLATQGPVRATLIRLSGAEHVLFAVFHHIAVDGTALRLLSAELEAAYEAASGGAALPPATPRPAAPAAPPEPSPEQVEFWRSALHAVPDLELPTDRPRGNAASFAGGMVPLRLPAELAAGVRQLAEREHATPFMVLLACYAVLLAGHSGQDSLVVGSPVSQRLAAADRAVVDLRIDTLPIPLRIVGGGSFRQLLAEVRRQCLAAQEHAAVPFERIAAERAAAGHRPDALIRALLAFHPESIQPWQQRGLFVEPFEFPVAGAQCELSVHLTGTAEGGYAGQLRYASALFDPATARRLSSGLDALVRAALEQPDRPVATLPIQAAEDERRVLAEFSGAGRPPLATGPVGRLFEEQVDHSPDAVAVSCADRRLSYRQLDEQANQLAGLLRELGVGPDRLVGLCLHRSERVPVALLAILKAGGCCLALDPGYPPHRLAQILAEARPVVVLAEAATRQLLADVAEDNLVEDEAAGTAARVVDLDLAADDIRRQPVGRLDVPVQPANLAFAVYTSGSTGRPKGALNTYAGLANRLAWARRDLPQQPGDGVLHKAPLGFDVAIGELLWPLVSGLRLEIARPGGHQDPSYLARTIVAAGIRACHFVPSMLRLFLADPASAECAGVLQRVTCSGEELPAELAAEFSRRLPGVALHNTYGPAETAIEVSAARVELAAGEPTPWRLSIGRPFPGVRLYVLDSHGRPVPIGVPGELYIGGIALARGYLAQPALTAERFVPDPYQPGGRLYRSGDRVRWREDGELEFFGRSDNQLKIRGQRVEPAEIEASLAEHPAVSAACVRPEADQRLVGYLVCAEPAPSAAELREHLARRLPRYMIPAEFVRLAALPIGPNGKLNRDLLVGGEPLPDSDSYQPPGNPVEQALVEIWQELLEVPRVGVHDDFYALGGHSLLAIRVVARIRTAFGIELDVTDLLLHKPTVAGLAEVVLQRQLGQADDEALARALARVTAMSDADAAAALARGWNADGST